MGTVILATGTNNNVIDGLFMDCSKMHETHTFNNFYLGFFGDTANSISFLQKRHHPSIDPCTTSEEFESNSIFLQAHGTVPWKLRV